MNYVLFFPQFLRFSDEAIGTFAGYLDRLDDFLRNPVDQILEGLIAGEDAK